MVNVGVGLVIVLITLFVLLTGGVLLYDYYESRERNAKEAQEAAAEARVEAARVIKRRAVLDLLDPGLVPMLCPIPGEAIGRQLVEMRQNVVRDAVGGAPGCTPATRIEADAWAQAFRSAPAEHQLAAARRAVVGVDPSPKIPFVDAETGQLYDVARSDVAATVRNRPGFLPATPKQTAAWDSAEGEDRSPSAR
jgi:hypothetical protein